MVFNHDEMELKMIEAQLAELKKELQKLESTEDSQIVPPYAVSTLWPNLTYQDLHLEPETKDKRYYRRRIYRYPDIRSSTPINSGGNSSSSSPQKSMNKAIATPSKLLDALKKEWPDLTGTPQEDPDVRIIQTGFNQIKKMKVTEVQIQCNLPFTRTNFQMDEMRSEILDESDCESDTSYLDFDDQVGEDMLSYVIDNLKPQNDLPNVDLDIIQRILDETEVPTENNNDETCLSLESSPDKYLIPDPLESIAQLDGQNDEEESPKKDFTIGKIFQP